MVATSSLSRASGSTRTPSREFPLTPCVPSRDSHRTVHARRTRKDKGIAPTRSPQQGRLLCSSQTLESDTFWPHSAPHKPRHVNKRNVARSMACPDTEHMLWTSSEHECPESGLPGRGTSGQGVEVGRYCCHNMRYNDTTREGHSCALRHHVLRRRVLPISAPSACTRSNILTLCEKTNVRCPRLASAGNNLAMQLSLELCCSNACRWHSHDAWEGRDVAQAKVDNDTSRIARMGHATAALEKLGLETSEEEQGTSSLGHWCPDKPQSPPHEEDARESWDDQRKRSLAKEAAGAPQEEARRANNKHALRK